MTSPRDPRRVLFSMVRPRAARAVLLCVATLASASASTLSACGGEGGGEGSSGVDSSTASGNAGSPESGVATDSGGDLALDASAALDGSPASDGSTASDASPQGDAGRDPTLQPFSEKSVWNLPIGSNATWSDADDADTKQLASCFGNVLMTTYGKPFYVGTPSDPVVTVTNSDTGYPVPAQSIHIPAEAKSAEWLTFFDTSQPRYMWSYYSGDSCQFGSDAGMTTSIACQLGAVSNVCGDGVTNLSGAGRYDFSIGTIRHWELDAGQILHSLRFAVSLDVAKSPHTCASVAECPDAWKTDIPFPNDNEDYYGPISGHAGSYSGEVIFGSTIGIPSTVDLTKLSLSTGGMMLARALQDHGAIMRDTTGQYENMPHFAFYGEPQDSNHPRIVEMNKDMPTIMSQLRLLRNQSAATPNGGGTPRTPLVAPIRSDICPP